MKELLFEYLESARRVKNTITQMKDELKIIDGERKKDVEADVKRVLNSRKAFIENEMAIYRSMLSDLEFAIEWIRSGHNPNDNRALDKRTVYLLDNKTIAEVIKSDASYIKVSTDEYDDYINDVNHAVSHALRKLSKRELEVFLMMKCEGMSSRDVAELLDVKYTTVESHMERAKRKIERELDSNLFLMC
ncbi:sigma factor-like helix-turn-helix DNA-binding protein [Macrococcus armenti]|uniref:sigma factor-like helix-turn-helix DNA-binding protein n=1 Tax=Macrococcus armenti TaxID=2875764 RepID=UPI001CCB152A|nr:sigma factor-like helix-turn-helix DNA-binding protein [Macrococcus armenti]UBH16390.1 LuxR C-terminal-related transcriptional regulator [Macrococcus armenti]UBH18746.1 LuxR C-terminal-related transcriptional regulator [Macrococcus armenti]UBH21018.1 LuxR C-terminal-related transcriptional regulator [Macrococcus armenti]